MAATVQPQHMDALARANTVRLARAETKRWVQMRRPGGPPTSVERAIEVVMDPPEHCESMPVFDLLLCVPRWGRQRAVKLLGAARISESKTLGGLTMRQRGLVRALLLGVPVSDDWRVAA